VIKIKSSDSFIKSLVSVVGFPVVEISYK
jgi:hypothetical protein